MMGDLTITTTLEPFGPATAIILTDDQVAALGAGKRAPLRHRRSRSSHSPTARSMPCGSPRPSARGPVSDGSVRRSRC
ncbi:hypothetical protein BN10_120006 [Phycicoccus elongatus Lp2]|uniref:Uncharacterized protein n=1 Tax=Phycicoccus elongatus Lp2 TaxID=1193181 RepID=N0DZN0_9MICO|nr:hypothetical protein BN10_120006 [Phycicoccus elongatus Lp2]